MPHGGVQELQLVLHADLLELGPGGGVLLRPLPTVFHVDGIHVLHQVDGLPLSDILMERAAKVVGDIILSVGESPGAAEAAHNRAGPAADAAFHPVPIDGAMALLQGVSRLEHGNLQFRPFPGQLIGREYPSRPRSHNDDIVLHDNLLAFHRPPSLQPDFPTGYSNTCIAHCASAQCDIRPL